MEIYLFDKVKHPDIKEEMTVVDVTIVNYVK